MDLILFPSLSGDDHFCNVHLVLGLPEQKLMASSAVYGRG